MTMLEQLLALLQQNPDAAAMQLAASGVPAPTAGQGLTFPDGSPAPTPTPRPAGLAGALPGAPDPAQQGQDKIATLLKALGAVQTPEPPKGAGVSIQGGNPGFLTNFAPPSLAQQNIAFAQPTPPVPGGLAAALMRGR